VSSCLLRTGETGLPHAIHSREKNHLFFITVPVQAEHCGKECQILNPHDLERILKYEHGQV
jgi:hypothetical protein